MQRICSLFAVLLGLAAFSAGLPAPSTHVVHEKRNGVSARWINPIRVRSESEVIVKVGLAQRNLHRAEEYLMDVSHPSSSNYGRHWTSDKVIKAFAPSDGSVAAVRDWLNGAGIGDVRITHSDNKGWLAFVASGDELENLLHAKYYEYEDAHTGEKTITTERYHVPKRIQKHIDFVTPGIKFPLSGKTAKGSGGLTKRRASIRQPIKVPFHKKLDMSDLSTCDQVITPDCVAALYQIPAVSTTPSPNNSLGIFEEGDFYAQEDLDLFFQNFSSHGIPTGTAPTPAFIDGATAPTTAGHAGGESDLDFELAYPIIYPQTITLYQTDDSVYANGAIFSQGVFNTFLDAIDGSYCTSCAFGECGNSNIDPVYPDTSSGGYKGQLQCGVYTPTNVISISYGGNEDTVPTNYEQRQCFEFMKLGLQGVSILFASGDSGVGGREGCLGSNSTVFNPGWPASCPYITSVGATKVLAGRTVNESESAANDPIGKPFSVAFASGGGFSNIYSIPSYQADAVATYFKDHNPPYPYYSGNQSLGANNGRYNRTGRGYPDVSANGDNIATFTDGSFLINGGTSASSPIFASIINRIIDERIAAGKGPLGFLNPVLYSNPQVLNDITNGTNSGCNTDGFSTAPGWDPVTGLGTPNYPKMLKLFLSLP